MHQFLATGALSVAILFSTVAPAHAALSRASQPGGGQPAAQPAPTPGPESRRAGAWTLLDRVPTDSANGPGWIRPERGQALAVDLDALRAALAGAPLEGSPAAQTPGGPLVFSLPDPLGRLQRFSVVESPVMAPELARTLPEVRTYVGQGLDDPAAMVRFDITPAGFHAMVLAPRALAPHPAPGPAGEPVFTGGVWFIDPFTRADSVHHTSYYKRDLANPHAGAWACAVQEEDLEEIAGVVGPTRAGATLRTYRAAVACTGEYAAFHGGSVAQAQAAIVTAINRVNAVYEREFSVRLVLIANNTSLVFTNAATDPFTNAAPGTLIGESQATIDSVIGSANYDIGHTLNTGGGGLAGLGVVCRGGNKARGVTGLSSPTGDGFYIDYLCHEIGHQFGASHTFNGVNGSCSGNRSGNSAYEPGSGSTIMGYTGICGADDLQRDAEVMFHSRSFDQVLTYTTTGQGSGCSQTSATGNLAPTVSAGSNRTIPSRTPFALTAVGGDPNGDPLVYSWEQRDLGPAAALNADDDGLIPLVRTDGPVASPVRLIPELARLVFGQTSAQERLPQVQRTMRWRVTARDNRAGGGGVNTADVTLTVVGAAGPFQITSPNTPVSWPATTEQTVTWDVAGTTASGINAATVNVLFSPDGGQTFPITLAAGAPNTGSASFAVPAQLTGNGRIKVEAVGNIFFDISNASIAVTAAPPPPPSNVTASPNPGCAGQQVILSAVAADPGFQVQWFEGSCGGQLAGFGPTIVLTLPPGGKTYFCRVRDVASGINSACASVAVAIGAPPEPPASASASRTTVCPGEQGDVVLVLDGAGVGGERPGQTARWFSGSCSEEGSVLVGVGASLTIPAPVATTTYFGRWESPCGASACAAVTVTVANPADFNGDGVTDPDDLSDYIGCYFASPACAEADFNGDGQADPDDLSDYIGRFFTGC